MVENPSTFRYNEFVEAISEKRFDPYFDIKFAARVLLDIVRKRSLESVMEKIVRAAVSTDVRIPLGVGVIGSRKEA